MVKISIALVVLEALMALGDDDSPNIARDEEDSCKCRLTLYDHVVCGSNGQLYMNQCHFDCEAGKDSCEFSELSLFFTTFFHC